MTLHVLRTGVDAAIPLLLLHAFPLDHRMWAAVAEELPEPRTVLAMDLPVRGEPVGEPSLDAAADTLAETLRKAGFSRVVVAGASMGGYLALAVADRHPDLVAGLGLIDTKSVADTPEAAAIRMSVAESVEASGTLDTVRQTMAALFGDSTRTVRPEVVAMVEAWVDEQPPSSVAWCQRAMAVRPDRTAVLRAFVGPVTVVVGDEDRLTGVPLAQHLVDTAIDAHLVVVPHAGHLAVVEDPATVAEALDELAQRADR